MGLSEMKSPFFIVNEIPSAKNLPYLVEHDNVTMLRKGQHSLTSVERPSYLRSDFVNV